DPDVICLQETKMSVPIDELVPPGYSASWNFAEKKGYSGTAVFSRVPIQSIQNDMGIPEHDREGRVIRAEFDDFYLIDCYTPNSQDGLKRLPYRMRWEDDFRAWLVALDQAKPVVLCGDLNVAHTPIDIKNAAANRKNAGFTDEERGKFTELLAAGFVDSFRHLYPDARHAYTWWSYFGNARANNSGWRIDYFCVSRRAADRIEEAAIHADIFGSDHCPVSLILR
ncbi:MAG: exodeoxyribonuclease III, partial [Clostridiales bacterium]|nr:exodeoxyribonuclease III [Clostridiales bacterium]